MKLTSLVIIAIVGLSFIGCGKQLNVIYNKDKDQTKIELAEKSYILEDSKEIRNSSVNMNPFEKISGSITTSYSSKQSVCSNIRFMKYPRLAHRMYYLSSAQEDIYKQYKNNCTTEKIDGLEYHDCKFNYVITQDITGQYGVAEKKYLTLNNKLCFNKLKAIAKDEENKKQTVGLSDKSISYIGKFSADNKNNREMCPSEGKIIANIVNDKISGYVKFTLNNKKYHRNLIGHINGNEFHGETERVKFYGDILNGKITNGEYFNRKCKGTFSLDNKENDLSHTKKSKIIGKLKYHNNLPLKSRSPWGNQSEIHQPKVGVVFDATKQFGTLDKIRVYLKNKSDKTQTFNLYVYRHNKDASIHDVLITKALNQKVKHNFNFVPITIDVPNVLINDETFFVVIEWNTKPDKSQKGNNSFKIATDGNLNYEGNFMCWINNEWKNSSELKKRQGDFLITAMFKRDESK